MPYDCPWDECNARYLRRHALKRHILNVHEKVLERPSYECSKCAKTFTTSDSYQRHKKTIHGELKTIGHETVLVKKIYTCTYCELRTPRKDHLMRHIHRQHTIFELFKCHDCGSEFKCKAGLRRHIVKLHLEKRAIKEKNKCLLCRESFPFIRELRKHLVKEHDVNLDAQTLSFSSMQEFLAWKKELEDSTITRFPIKSSKKNKGTFFYGCHRSGTYTEKSSDRKRNPFLRGSKKLNGICPASIKLFKNGSSYTATFIQTHLGHSVNDSEELKYTFLHKEERQKIANLIASGVPNNQILYEYSKGSGSLLDGAQSTNVSRKKLLNHRDLWNVAASFNLKSNENFTQLYEKDSDVVEVFDNQYEDSILLDKRENETCPEKFLDYEMEHDFSIGTNVCQPSYIHGVLMPLRERQPKISQNSVLTEIQEISPYMNKIDEMIDVNIVESVDGSIETMYVINAESNEENIETIDVNIAESAEKNVDEALNERLKNKFESLLSKLSSREDQIMLQNQLQIFEARLNAKNTVLPF